MASATVPNIAFPRDRPGEGGLVIARSRRMRNLIWWSLCAFAMVLVVGVVAWVLEGVIQSAVPGWNWSIFTEPTNGVGGGLANAISGTAVLMLGVGILTGITGVGAGIYLAEMARPGHVTMLLRSASEVLSGVPSIVFGYTGYVALVVGLHWGFSLVAALIVLSLLVVPYVAKSTEIALNQVPLAYREGGDALGISQTRLLRTIVIPAAIPGMATGLIVALAISVGETAPLLYTAGFSNSYPSAQLIHTPVPYLTYATYTFWNQPTTALKDLSFDSSVLLMALILLLVICSRFVVRVSQRYAPNKAGSRGRRRIPRRALERVRTANV